MGSVSTGQSQLGAVLHGDNCTFRVWAPNAAEVQLKIVSPKERLLQMRRSEDGYFTLDLPKASSRLRYFYRLNDASDIPDPASRSQPDGVHGASEVYSQDFQWTDGTWFG